MKNPYAVIGLIIIIIIGALYVLNRGGAAGSGASPSTLTLTSSAFENGGSIPSGFTCDATPPGTNPPLAISGVPAGTVSLALLMDDPDVPKQVLPAGVFDHWVLFNIPPSTSAIAASSTVGTFGANGAGKNAYTGPCPPPQYEPSEHRYFFRLYALDIGLAAAPGATKLEILKLMSGHIIAQTELVGKYKRVQ